MSISNCGASAGSFSITTTSTPREDKIYAHSKPIAPEPIIAIDFGSSSRFNKSSEFKIFSWLNSKPLSSLGIEPVAITIFFAS